MKRLDQLPQIAGEALGGLKAGAQLKKRIEAAAAAPTPFKSRQRALRPALAMLCVCVLAVGLYAAMPGFHPAVDPDTIHSIAAGQPSQTPKLRAMLDLPPGSVKLSAGTSVPEYRSIWAPKNGADFPLIAVQGRYYRLMNSPSSVPESMLGDKLGDIQEFTGEPSLSKTDSLLSNAVAQGETVWALENMNGAAVAAKVDGSLRVFQRISYAGAARVGTETLNDTLKVSGKAVGLELSGVGTITDAAVVADLVSTLLNNASYENASLISSDQSLLIQLDSGMTLQLLVKDDMVSACGSWSCPEFFEAFGAAAAK